MRNMSFAETTPQIRNRIKTVTRRLGWAALKKGDLVQPCLKCMGLKKGEKIQKIGPPIRILSTGFEPLDTITQEDIVKEGFPDLTVEGFITFFQRINRCPRNAAVNRIEFEYMSKQGERNNEL